MGTDTHLGILRIGRAIVAFIYAVVTVCLVLLTLAFFLQLFGANPAADFTEWVYRSVRRIMEPFRGMFPSEQLGERSVLNFSLLFAMIVYAILALALHALVSWLTASVVKARQEERRARALAPPVGEARSQAPPWEADRGGWPQEGPQRADY